MRRTGPAVRVPGPSPPPPINHPNRRAHRIRQPQARDWSEDCGEAAVGMAAKRAFVGVQTRLAAERFDDYHQIHIFGAARADRREVHGGLQEGLRWSVRSASRSAARALSNATPLTRFFRDALTS